MRLQLALNVEDLQASIDYYEKLFGVSVAKVKPGYANFEVNEPPLKLVLFEGSEVGDRLNHLGVEVFDDALRIGEGHRPARGGEGHGRRLAAAGEQDDGRQISARAPSA